MNPKLKYGLIGTLVIALGLFVRGCFTDGKAPKLFSEPLDPAVHSQLVVSDRHVAIRTDKETKAGYVPSDGHVVITTDKEGKIEFDVKNKGFAVRPVVGLLVTDGVRGALGAQVGYWNRVELHAGLAYPSLIGYGGIGYRLDQFSWTRNTSLLVAYTTSKHIGVGLVVRF